MTELYNTAYMFLDEILTICGIPFLPFVVFLSADVIYTGNVR